MSQIAGVFDNAELANQAVTALMSAGLTKDDISIVMSDKAKERFYGAPEQSTGNRATVDGAIGAGTGGVLGGLLAGLTTVGAVLIPGAQLLVVGPLVAVLSGVGAGAAVGGLAGALAALGLSAVESNKYETELKAGKVVIVAHTRNDAQRLVARSALLSEGATIKAA